MRKFEGTWTACPCQSLEIRDLQLATPRDTEQTLLVKSGKGPADCFCRHAETVGDIMARHAEAEMAGGIPAAALRIRQMQDKSRQAFGDIAARENQRMSNDAIEVLADALEYQMTKHLTAFYQGIEHCLGMRQILLVSSTWILPRWRVAPISSMPSRSPG